LKAVGRGRNVITDQRNTIMLVTNRIHWRKPATYIIKESFTAKIKVKQKHACDYLTFKDLRE
jgi:beta-lactamase regulating signal transducer with metallopeptidase domain